jgi:hypothetical protein
MPENNSDNVIDITQRILDNKKREKEKFMKEYFKHVLESTEHLFKKENSDGKEEKDLPSN